MQNLRTKERGLPASETFGKMDMAPEVKLS